MGFPRLDLFVLFSWCFLLPETFVLFATRHPFWVFGDASARNYAHDEGG